MTSIQSGWAKHALGAICIWAGFSACTPIGGIDKGGLGTTGSGGMGGSGESSTSSSSTGSSGGGMVCQPDKTMTCYSGPANTPNIGFCKPGSQTCLADGTGYGPCVGEVVPQAENCVAVGDEDCDGLSDLEDSECVCTTPGAKTPCDTGKLGVCKIGSGVCAADGRSVDMCMQATTSSAENCATPEDEDCDGAAHVPCNGQPIWTQTTPGSAIAPNDDSTYAVAMTPDGGYIIAGMVDGTIGSDSYGVTAGKAYLAKFDATKNLVWEKRYVSTTFGVIRGVAVDKDGNIIIGGAFSGTLSIEGIDLAADGTDVFLAKLNPQGMMQWTRQINALKVQTVSGVSVDALANIFVVGTTDNDIDLGGGIRVAEGTDFFMASYTPDNAHRWSKIYNSSGAQYGRAITTMANGDIAIIGDSEGGDVNLGGGTVGKFGGVDFFVARYTGDTGNHVWGKLFGKAGGLNDQTGRSIASTPDGNVAITGTISTKMEWAIGVTMTALGTSDVYVAKLDGQTGDYLMHAHGGKSGTSIGNSLATDAAGNVTVCGQMLGGIDFGGQPAASFPSTVDTFVVKLKSTDYTPLWTNGYGKAGKQIGWSVAVAPDGMTLVGGGFGTELDVPPAMPIATTGGMDLFGVLVKP